MRLEAADLRPSITSRCCMFSGANQVTAIDIAVCKICNHLMHIHMEPQAKFPCLGPNFCSRWGLQLIETACCSFSKMSWTTEYSMQMDHIVAKLQQNWNGGGEGITMCKSKHPLPIPGSTHDSFQVKASGDFQRNLCMKGFQNFVLALLELDRAGL